MGRAWILAAGGALGLLLGYGLLRGVVLPRGAVPASGCPGRTVWSGSPQGQQKGLGLARWTVFEASGSHDLNLSGRTAHGPLVTRWAFRAGGPIVSAPAVVAGTAYFGSLDHCVYALDVATGRLRWAFRTPNEVMSEPLVAGRTVVVGVGNKTIVAVGHGWRRGTGPSGVYALDAATGRLRWRYPTPGEVMPTPVLARGVVYAATGNAVFYALDAASGHLLWRLPLTSLDSMSSPVLVGTTAVFGGTTPFVFFGVDVAARRLAWARPVPDAAGGVDDISPAAVGDTVYVQVPYGVYPHVTVEEWALSTRTGATRWRRVLGRGVLHTDGREEVGVAALVGGVLYVGSPALHGLWALSARSGGPRWSRPAPLPVGVRATPLVVGRRILVLAHGRLFILSRHTGALRGVRTVGRPGPLASCAPPAPERVGQTLLVVGGRHEETLQALPLAQLPGMLPVPRGRIRLRARAPLRPAAALR